MWVLIVPQHAFEAKKNINLFVEKSYGNPHVVWGEK